MLFRSAFTREGTIYKNPYSIATFAPSSGFGTDDISEMAAKGYVPDYEADETTGKPVIAGYKKKKNVANGGIVKAFKNF